MAMQMSVFVCIVLSVLVLLVDAGAKNETLSKRDRALKSSEYFSGKSAAIDREAAASGDGKQQQQSYAAPLQQSVGTGHSYDYASAGHNQHQYYYPHYPKDMHYPSHYGASAGGYHSGYGEEEEHEEEDKKKKKKGLLGLLGLLGLTGLAPLALLLPLLLPLALLALLLLPIPVIVVTGGTATPTGGGTGRRRRSLSESKPDYFNDTWTPRIKPRLEKLTELTMKVWSSDQCLERFACEMEPRVHQSRTGRFVKWFFEKFHRIFPKKWRDTASAYLEPATARSNNEVFFSCNHFKCDPYQDILIPYIKLISSGIPTKYKKRMLE